MTPDEKFFAWLDGELPPDEAAAMDAKVASDPALCQLAEQHRELAAQLRGAFAPVVEAPMPDRLLDAVRAQPAEVVDLAAARRKASFRLRPAGALPQWAAMAATLVVGMVVGTLVSTNGGAPVEVQGGKLYAAAALERSLDTQLASAPAGRVRIGLTFRDRSGAICRSFTDAQASGLACRDDGRWQVRGLFAAPEAQAGDYRMAAGMDPNLAALVDSTMAGEPFDAAAENAAREGGWR